MDPRYEIRAFLRVLRDAWRQEQSDAHGLAYRGAADFLLQHGRWWPAAPLPTGVERLAPRACFGNSINSAVAHDLRYVEGYALHALSDLPVPHAWVADAAGHALDVTWDPPGRAYLGVEFSVERADDATWNGDAHVLDDFARGWPVLRERWRGELPEPDPAWKPSPGMLAMLAWRRGDHEEAARLYSLLHEEVAGEPSGEGYTADRVRPILKP